MRSDSYAEDRATDLMRRIARGIASFAGAFWLLAFIVSFEVVSGNGPVPLDEGTIPLGLVTIVSLGVTISCCWCGSHHGDCRDAARNAASPTPRPPSA